MNSVFIATSLDGYIADKEGGIAWLESIPNPDQDDMGYFDFMGRVDAMIMGRTTFETVLGFDIEWPYDKPVFVLSNKLDQIPESLNGKAFLVKGPLKEVLRSINEQGYHNLYIDGGSTISSFLKEDLIDEMILTTIPILLGGGSPLFSELPNELPFDLKDTKTYLNQITQRQYIRRR